MDNNIVWTCIFCNYNPSSQSSRNCPRCGRKLTSFDISSAPIERQKEWPTTKDSIELAAEIEKNSIDYTAFFEKSDK